jgi:hypothetical protein
VISSFFIVWHVHLARVFTGGTPVPLTRNQCYGFLISARLS